MSAGNWIAIYAAAVATAALLWQAATYRSAHKTRLRVRLGLILFAETVDEAMALTESPGDWRAEVEVLNLGRSPARVSSVNVVRNPRTGDGITSWTSKDWGLPWPLEPGESRTIMVTADQAGPIHNNDELTAYVYTEAHQQFASDPLIVGAEKSDTLVAIAFSAMETVAGKGLTRLVRYHNLIDLADYTTASQLEQDDE